MSDKMPWWIAAERTPPKPAAEVILTLSAEQAARVNEGRVGGMSIAGADLPAPVAAKDHAMFLDSKRHPGVVWPL